MNANDRKLIADVLGGITSDNTITIINSGLELLKKHPKIQELMDESELTWWGIKPCDKKIPTHSNREIYNNDYEDEDTYRGSYDEAMDSLSPEGYDQGFGTDNCS